MPRTVPTATPMRMDSGIGTAADQQLGGNRPGQGQDRTHRQVDTAGQDHEQLADRHDAEDGDLAGQVGEVVAGEEVVAGQRQAADGDQQDDQPAAFPAGDVAKGHDPAFGRRRSRRVGGCAGGGRLRHRRRCDAVTVALDW